MALAFFAQWGLDSFLRRSGRVVFYGEQNQVVRTITFFEAHCVLYHAALHPDVQGQAALTLTLALSPAAIDHQGQHVESHSLLPWAAPAATRRRVLTSPADLLPSPGLRAAAQAAAKQASQPADTPLYRKGKWKEGYDEDSFSRKAKASRKVADDDYEDPYKLDSKQLRIVRKALETLQQRLTLCAGSLERWEEKDQATFKKAFGRTKAEDCALIQERVSRMRGLVDAYLADPALNDSFRIAPEAEQEPGAIALVYPDDAEHKVYLCPTFWRNSADGLSQSETLAHELSHFDDIGPTEDHEYGLDECVDLAKRDPVQALENADSFAYYIEGFTQPAPPLL